MIATVCIRTKGVKIVQITLHNNYYSLLYSAKPGRYLSYSRKFLPGENFCQFHQLLSNSIHKCSLIISKSFLYFLETLQYLKFILSSLIISRVKYFMVCQILLKNKFSWIKLSWSSFQACLTSFITWNFVEEIFCGHSLIREIHKNFQPRKF